LTVFILLIFIVVFRVTILKNKFHQCFGGMLIMFLFHYMVLRPNDITLNSSHLQKLGRLFKF